MTPINRPGRGYTRKKGGVRRFDVDHGRTRTDDRRQARFSSLLLIVVKDILYDNVRFELLPFGEVMRREVIHRNLPWYHLSYRFIKFQ